MLLPAVIDGKRMSTPICDCINVENMVDELNTEFSQSMAIECRI